MATIESPLRRALVVRGGSYALDVASGTSSRLAAAQERVGALSRLCRDKTRRAYAAADELRRIGAQLEDAVAELAAAVAELSTDTEEDTADEQGHREPVAA